MHDDFDYDDDEQSEGDDDDEDDDLLMLAIHPKACVAASCMVVYSASWNPHTISHRCFTLL